MRFGQERSTVGDRRDIVERPPFGGYERMSPRSERSFARRA